MSEDTLTVRLETESGSAEQVAGAPDAPPSPPAATGGTSETVLALEVGRLSATVDEVCRRLGAVESGTAGAVEDAEIAVEIAVDAAESAQLAQGEAAIAVDVAELAEIEAIAELATDTAPDEPHDDDSPPDREHPFFRPRRRNGDA